MNYDIVFVGSGLSSSATLYHILSGLREQKIPGRLINIAVIEKNQEFWTGIPYGKRSSLQSLTINPVKDFLTEAETAGFFTWLKDLEADNYPGIANAERGIIGAWTRKNGGKLEGAARYDLYIPRFLYGLYLSQKMEKVIASAKADNIAHVELVCGEAVDIQQISGASRYMIDIEADGRNFEIACKILVLSTGSLGTRKITNGLAGPHLCINDIYEPSLTVNFKKITDQLLAIKPAKRNVLIIGSNASASEIVHLLAAADQVDNGIFNQIFILSTSGLPDHLHVNADHDHLLQNLKALSEAKNFTADELMTAIENDVKYAAQNQLSVGRIHYSLSDRVVKMQQKLNADEALRFFTTYGWPFTRITRRTNEDYYYTAKDLEAAQRLHYIKGRFVKPSEAQTNSDGLTFVYTTAGDKTEKEYGQVFPVIVHCGGAEQLCNTSSRLIAGLLEKGICEINETNMGLAVDENFLANDGLYIIGPLLAGIYNAKFKFWHLENSKRLNILADALADTLLSKIGSAN